MAIVTRWIDFPQTIMNSVHEPIKMGIDLNGSTSTVAGQGTILSTDIVSIKFRVRRLNQIENLYFTSDDVYVRVQPNVDRNLDYLPIDHFANTQPYFTVDLSSICRQSLSYDLRPPMKDSDDNRQWEIHGSVPSWNTFGTFRVSAVMEYIKVDGTLGEIEIEGEKVFKAANIILEENLIQEHHASNSKYHLTTWYWNHYDSRYNSSFKGKMKFFTDKPNIRTIREDECEYVTWFGQSHNPTQESNPKYYPHLQIQFFNLSGAYINYATINEAFTYDGVSDNVMFANATNAEYGDRLVVQSGVGTRNIDALPDAKFGGGSRVDLSTVSYYTVNVKYINESGNVIDQQAGSPYTDAASETLRFNLDRSPTLPTGQVRFHWQNRKGGIDSYTCQGGTIESVSTSSTNYERSIYPRFSTRLQSSVSSTDIIESQSRAGIGGVSKNEYHKLSKLSVNATKEFSATTRPLSMDNARWIEDLLVSANVWIEVIDNTIPNKADEHLYVPVVIKDGSTQLVSSEGLTTIEIKYALSKPRKTHRN